MTESDSPNSMSTESNRSLGKMGKLYSGFLARQLGKFAAGAPEAIVSASQAAGLTALEYNYLDKYRVLLDPNSKSIVKRTLSDGSYQISIMETVTRLFPERDIPFIDVGANVGTTILNAHHFGFRTFIALEPVKNNFRLLRNNLTSIASDSDVTLHNCAAGSSPGKARINMNPKSTGRHSLAHSYGGGHEDIDVVRLDDILPKSRSFLWIDAEGFELDVLKGGIDFVRNHAAALCVEIAPEITTEKNINDVSDLLEPVFSKFTTIYGEETRRIRDNARLKSGRAAGIICLK